MHIVMTDPVISHDVSVLAISTPTRAVPDYVLSMAASKHMQQSTNTTGVAINTINFVLISL